MTPTAHQEEWKMKRNLVLFGIVAAFGVAAIVAGAGDTSRAVACDHATKTAATTATPSCCAKGNTATAADAKSVHSAMIRSAVVAPGSAPIMNIAAFGGMVASDGHADCEWCTPEMCRTAEAAAAAGCPAFTSAGNCSAAHGAAMSGGCEAHAAGMSAGCSQSAGMHASGCPMSATTASVENGGPHAAMPAGSDCCAGKATATTASVNSSDCSAHMAASTCAKSMTASECSAHMAAMAAGTGTCDQAMKASAAGSSCCSSASAASAGCEKGVESAAIKQVSDEVPYAENKRVVLTGSYVCAHCSLHATEACAPMFKTEDGKVYPLMKTSRASDLRKAGKTVEVSTRVRKIDGVKYLEVTSYKAL
jgi:hypothetical protein